MEIEQTDWDGYIAEIESVNSIMPYWMKEAVDARLSAQNLQSLFASAGLVARYWPNSRWPGLVKKWFGSLNLEQQNFIETAFRQQAELVKRSYELLDADSIFEQLYTPGGHWAFRHQFMKEMHEVREDLESLAEVLKLNGRYSDFLKDIHETVNDEGTMRMTQFGEIVCETDSDWHWEWRESLHTLDKYAWWAFEDCLPEV